MGIDVRAEQAELVKRARHLRLVHSLQFTSRPVLVEDRAAELGERLAQLRLVSLREEQRNRLPIVHNAQGENILALRAAGIEPRDIEWPERSSSTVGRALLAGMLLYAAAWAILRNFGLAI